MVVPAREQQEVDRLKESLGEWALGDVKKALAGGAKVGSFLLAAHFIDVLARLARTTSDGKAAWDEFVPDFLESYANYAEGLYRGYRGLLSHSYSVEGFRFVDTERYRHRHLAIESGDCVLHLETFIEDLERAWSKFMCRVEEDDVFRERVLERTRRAPLLTVLDDAPGSASLSHHAIRLAHPTHWGAAEAASGSPGAGWPYATPRMSVKSEPPPTPEPPPTRNMAIPKGTKRKRKKKK
jgi:hypothetical protein